MKAALVGLLVGLGIGGVNQLIMWWALWRTGAKDGKAAIVGRYMGGCAVRLLLDATALYLSWRLTQHVAGLLAAATGLLGVTGIMTIWQYRSLKGRRRLRREAKR